MVRKCLMNKCLLFSYIDFVKNVESGLGLEIFWSWYLWCLPRQHVNKALETQHICLVSCFTFLCSFKGTSLVKRECAADSPQQFSSFPVVQTFTHWFFQSMFPENPLCAVSCCSPDRAVKTQNPYI